MKKIIVKSIVLILILIVIVIVPKFSFATDTVLLGDATGDNKIDVDDILMILRHTAAINTGKNQEWVLKDKNFLAANVVQETDKTNAEKIDVLDMLRILRYIAAKENKEIESKHKDWLELGKMEITTPTPIPSTQPNTTPRTQPNTTPSTPQTPNETVNPSVTVPVQPNIKISVNKIALDKTSAILEKGSSLTLRYTLTPQTATNKNVIWSTTNAKVVTVKDGVVKAVGRGTAYIKITSKDGNKTAQCKVTVKEKVTSLTIIANKNKITQNKNISLNVKDTLQLQVTSNPSNAEITYKSSNAKVAKVSKTGKITIVGKGNAKITVTASLDAKKSISFNIKAIKQVTGVTLNKKNLTLKTNDTAKLTATLSPTDASDKTLTWKSSNSKVATVDSKGNVKGVNIGTATITVTSKSNTKKTSSCTISVVPSTDVFAVGINGGVRVGWKKVKNATSYVLKVRDYDGKIYKVDVPNNTNKHGYNVYKTEIGDMIYWNVKKLNDNFNTINNWMNKNEKIYKFKVIAYGGNDGKKEVWKSNWLKTMPFNVEKQAPDQDVYLYLPLSSYSSDPEKGAEGGMLGKEANKQQYTKRLYFDKILERDKNVRIRWVNNISNFKPLGYILRYKKYYSDNENANSKKEFKTIYLDANTKTYTIKNLTNEQEYLVQIMAYGMVNNDMVTMLAEEVVVPHTEATRKALLAKVNSNRGDPFTSADLTGYFTRAEAEAFANYGKNGKAFTSETKYFLWVNMYQVRLYIFTKTNTNEWRLLTDQACGICQKGGNICRPGGEYKLLGRMWAGEGSQFYTLRNLITYQDTAFGNVFHSVGVGTENVRMDQRERFCTAGCTTVDIPWLKWIYDYGMRSTLFNDFG